MINLKTKAKEPIAYITVGKQRTKQYDKSVYLNNGQEFEIELFNPTTNKVLAKIELNGNSIGSGIVLRPGERVFLERYIETAKMFLFETYKVDSNDPDVEEAIINNGKVNVRFYNEVIKKPIHLGEWVTNTYNTYQTPTITEPHIFYGSPSTAGSIEYSSHLTSTITGISNFESSIIEKDESKETGIIGEGGNSNQTFVNDTTDFNHFYGWETEWIILPYSEKQITIEEVNIIWCVECGSRRKKTSHKFCPHCGSKYE